MKRPLKELKAALAFVDAAIDEDFPPFRDKGLSVFVDFANGEERAVYVLHTYGLWVAGISNRGRYGYLTINRAEFVRLIEDDE